MLQYPGLSNGILSWRCVLQDINMNRFQTYGVPRQCIQEIVIGQVCSAVFLHCCNGIGLGTHICKLLATSSLLLKSVAHKSRITPSVKPLTPGKRENKLTIVSTCISAQGDGGAASCYCTRHSSTILQTKTTAICLRTFVTHLS